MQKTWAVLGLLLLLSVFIVSGCTVSAADGTVDATEPAPVNVLGPAAARDAVLAYLAETYGDKAPVQGLSWVEANVTVEGLVGGSAFQYTANGWVVKVAFPVVNPLDTVYHVVVSNEAAGFDWEGDVDADGVVVEAAGPEAAWYDPTTARDAVLVYLAENYGDRAPALSLTWVETDVTPGLPGKPLPGVTSLQYVAADWVMTLSYPVVRPDLVVYQVTVENAAPGFLWEGQVDAAGNVQTTQSENTDWKTYTNEKHGYSLRYPSDCTFGPMPAGCKNSPPAERPAECLCFLNAEDPDRVFLQTFTGEKDDLKGAAFSVERTVYDVPPGADLIEWIQEKLPHYEKVPDEPNAKVGGIPAVRFYTPRSPMAPSYEEIYFIQHGGFFRIHMLDVDEKSNRELYDQISAALDITVETSAVGVPVVAWYGSVISLPAGSQFDDYLSLMPEGAGEIGVEGANEAIEAQIVALRDQEARKYANFWGTLRCDVIDYGGCQLLVTRIRSGMDMTDPEPVEGWEGTIVELFYAEPGAPHPDDAFILAGDYPVQYGIASYIAENGLPIYKQELEKWRDTGQIILVSGQLICGFPDVNACQIQVNRIEIVGEPPAPEPVVTLTPVPVPTATLAPPLQSWAEPVEDWWGEIVSNPPGSQWDDYFERQIVNGGQYGIESLDPEIQAQIVALRDTGKTVHVWGTLYHNVPDFNAVQIQVTRIEVPEPPKPPEITEGLVDGWTGKIGKLPWGSQFGTFFERDDGQRFGIQALGADATVSQQIETHQWTGAQVRVWGRSIAGIPDVNGRRIEVERIEAVSGPEAGARNLAFFATASASSVLPSDRWGTYHAWSAIDDRLDSPWTEGVAGPGIGEWVMLTFPDKIEVWGIGLDVGYDRDADLFRANNRIKRAVLIFSNGEEVEVTLSDTQGVQMIALARAPGPSIETTYVKVVIKETYPGTRYDDTCLGEIEILGRTK